MSLRGQKHINTYLKQLNKSLDYKSFNKTCFYRGKFSSEGLSWCFYEQIPIKLVLDDRLDVD